MSLLVATKPTEAHKAVFDARSLVSLAVGAVAGVAGTNPAVLIVSLIAYEALDNEAFFGRPHARVESPANRIGDVLAGVVGYAAGEWLRNRKPELLTKARSYLDGSENA